jgi:hypothetical protein
MVLVNMVKCHAITSEPMKQLAVQLRQISSINISHIQWRRFTQLVGKIHSKYSASGLFIQQE